MLKDRDLILTQNVRLIESAAFPNLPFVTQLVATEPQTLIRAGPGFAVEHQNPIAGRRPGRKLTPIEAPGRVVLEGFEPFLGFFGAFLT